MNEIAKYGGLESVARLFKLVFFRNVSAGFKAINVSAAICVREEHLDQGLEEKIELINRQTAIME